MDGSFGQDPACAQADILVIGPRFQVRQVALAPGASLAMQSHLHRSEHWIVVQGTAKVTLGTSVRLVDEGQSVHVPLGARHRLENPGRLPMLMIEVQTGTYLGADDILCHGEDIADG